MAGELHLRVVTPDRTVLDRKVAAVSFPGIDGGYGILPNHAPMMTATRPGIAKITELDGTHDEMLISDGFAEIRDNVLTLICEAGELAHEIDLDRAVEAERRAREKLEHLHGDTDLPRVEAAMQRAMLRQMLARRKSGTGHV